MTLGDWSARLLAGALCLLPVWGQSAASLNLSEDLIRLGAASANMVPNQPNLDAAPLLVSGVNYAASHQIPTVIADPGAYYFLSLGSYRSHVVLSQVTGMTIDLQGSDLILANEQRIGIDLESCANLVLQNFTIDYQKMPFTQLQVISVDAAQRQVQFLVPPGWRDPSVFSSAQMLSGTLNGFYLFIFRGGQPAANLGRMQFQTPAGGNAFSIVDGGTPATSAATLAQIRPGDTAVLSARSNLQTILSYNCAGCVLRNIKVYSSPGVGVYVSYPQSALIDHVYTMPKPGTDRLVSTNADGITFSQPGANNTIRLSRSIRTQDDGFSPHSLIFGTVQSQSGTRSLQVQRQFNLTVQNGSPVVFQSMADGSMLGSAVIVTQTPPPTQAATNQQIVAIDFDRDLPANLAGAAIYTTDPAQRGSGTLLDRDTVQAQTFARGISLWGLMNSTVQGSYVRHSSMAGIDGTHQLNPGGWMSPPLIGLTLANNVIDGANCTAANGSLSMAGIQIRAATSQPMPTSPHQNIAVRGNFIADPAHSAIWIGNTTGGSVSGNYLLDPNDRGPNPYAYQPFSSYSLQPLVVETSQNIATGGNTIDQTSGRMFVTDTAYNELAAYAPKSVVRLNAYNLGKISDPAITLTDADGNTAALAIRNAADHFLDVQIPAGAELGGGFLTLAANSVKYFGTLFLDSVDNIPAVNGCTYEVSPSARPLSRLPGTVPVLVVTQAGCAYQAIASDSFATPGPAAKGTAVVSMAFAADAGSKRTALIEIAGRRFALRLPGSQGIRPAAARTQ